MVSNQDELDAAHVHRDRALVEWAHLKEHMVKHFANVRMSRMWEVLAPKGRMHSGLVCGLSLRCCEHFVLLKSL